MIRDATRDDFPSIREILIRSNDAPYDIGKVAEEKCFGAGFEGEPRVRIFGDFEGVAVSCGKHLRILAVDRERRGRGIGTLLVRDANAIVVAAEPGNYFTPGVPEDVARFFRKCGYVETVTTQNLICEASGEQRAASGTTRVQSAARRSPLAARRNEVLAFIEKHFGAIWRFEAAKAKTIFHVEEDGEIAGFSTHDANNRGLGWFGPTGVAKSHRGRGLGRELLLASLADLGRLGYHRVVIPWTDAIEFYRKSCGAAIEHRFVILRRKNG
ncbi:MAG TPA: GNAT family N-acetyltransferase [Thermoanaerobaculia bacterium]|nr:GNAT family N-acetyltransferase [Thermoanaerobaculia bacterium]